MNISALADIRYEHLRLHLLEMEQVVFHWSDWNLDAPSLMR